MRKFNIHLIGMLILFTFYLAQAQTVRETLEVPKADSGAVTIDGMSDEAAWSSAAEINLLTSSESNGWFNHYYFGDPLTEPDYEEISAKLLWYDDTLYVWMHVDEIITDTSDLYFDGGMFNSDQIFVALSNRLGVNMQGWYDGNPYAAPNGPYHYWIIGEDVSLNGGNLTYLPEEYMGCPEDTTRIFNASDYAKWGITIDEEEGIWDLEMAIYHPNVAANSQIAFNIGGSNAQSFMGFGEDEDHTYTYYVWQPSVPNEPYTDPLGTGDPGFQILANSEYWPLLNFTPGPQDLIREEINIPQADSGAIVIDGVMDEAEWDEAAVINLLTSSESNGWFNHYYFGDPLTEPDYEEISARLMWTKDTLYIFTHIDEIITDTSDLYFDGGQFNSDQLFIGLSNRLGVNMQGWYDGNPYAAPNGPYHYWIIGEDVSLNGGNLTYLPDEYMQCPDDTAKIFNASDYAKWGVTIDEAEGRWNVEIAIYHPNIILGSQIGFNIGGSNAQSFMGFGEDEDHTYTYYVWQPSVPNEPYTDPLGTGDPGFQILASSEYWPIINFTSGPNSVRQEKSPLGPPSQYSLAQNYPNPFNPTTTIKFQIPKQSLVSLKVYNIVGEEVATLVNNQVLGVGAYSAVLDASNLASGIYFYELRADNIVQTKKMVLLK